MSRPKALQKVATKLLPETKHSLLKNKASIAMSKQPSESYERLFLFFNTIFEGHINKFTNVDLIAKTFIAASYLEKKQTITISHG